MGSRRGAWARACPRTRGYYPECPLRGHKKPRPEPGRMVLLGDRLAVVAEFFELRVTVEDQIEEVGRFRFEV